MRYAETPAFVLQNLESRMLLSGCTAADVAAAPLVSAAAVIRVATRPHFTGAFTVTGTYSLPMVNPDAAKTYFFKGSCKPPGFGGMQLSGSVQTPGNLASGQAHGSFVMKNSHGTLKLSVTGPTEPAFGPMPTTLSYRITGGTGAYANASGSGTISDTLKTSVMKFVFRF